MKKLLIVFVAFAITTAAYSQQYITGNNYSYGVNTVLDGAKITLKGDTGNEWKALAFDGNTDDWFVGPFGGGGFFISKDNFSSTNAKFTISSSGRVGIGKESAYSASTLHVKSQTSGSFWTIMAEANNNDRVIGMSHDGNVGMISVSALAGAGFSPLQFNTSNIARMNIDVDGRIGMNVTSPYSGANLHIKSFFPGSPWGVMSEANANQRVAGIGHDGTNGVVTVSYLGSTAGYSPLQLHTSNLPRLHITVGGNILVGKTTQVNSAYILDVEGKVRSNEVIVNANGADFVFDKGYDLKSLDEVEKFIKESKHLPGIAPAKDMQENGVAIGEMEMKLLQKVEELTLYMIELKKEITEVKQENLKLKEEMKEIKKE